MTEDSADRSAVGGASRARRVPYRNNRYYLLAILTLIATFNLADRSLLSILVEDVKRDLALSDTQIGLLTGFAFTTCYALVGLPLARWADEGDRIKLVGVTTFVFSVMAMASGAVTSFAQLLLARIGLAAGEAGTMPAANSLLANAFDRSERPRAMALFFLSGSFATLIGFGVGGALNEAVGWRATCLLIGAPGVLLSLVAFATLRETRSGIRFSLAALAPDASMREAVRELWRIPTYRRLAYAYTLVGVFSVSIGLWQPAYFLRNFDVETGALGLSLAVVLSVAFAAGSLLGGELASRFAAHDESRQFRTMAVLTVISVVLSIGIYLVNNLAVALLLVGMTAAIGGGLYAPFMAGVQSVSPAHRRGVAIAVLLLLSQMAGTGGGTVLIGAMSDAMAPMLGTDALRFVLMGLMPGYLVVAWLYWRISQSIAGDIVQG